MHTLIFLRILISLLAKAKIRNINTISINLNDEENQRSKIDQNPE